MTFLKQNWFKAGLVLGVALVGISVAYYFFFFIPTKERAEAIRIKEKECTNLGQERYKQDTKDEFVTVTVNIYKYNKQLDSCFYLIEYNSVFTSNHEIIDLKTNVRIANYYEVKGSPTDSNQMVYFIQKKNEIFYVK